MEEIQSTEIIDREILEDARKKAWRILKTADDTVKAQALEWKQKTTESVEDLHRNYIKRIEAAKTEITSRLPMEKRRIKAQLIDQLLNQAVHEWYTGLERRFITKLLKNELKLQLAECAEFIDSPGRVLYSNLSCSEAEGIVSALLPEKKFFMEEIITRGEFPELILDTDTVRVSASVKKILDYFLMEKRAELISALVSAGEESC